VQIYIPSEAITPARRPGPAHSVGVRITEGVRQQVQEAAEAMGMPVSRWLGHVVACVTAADAPARWQPGVSAEEVAENLTRAALQSHNSRRYAWRFMIRVDEATGAPSTPSCSSSYNRRRTLSST
jgi:hypothetical protein